MPFNLFSDSGRPTGTSKLKFYRGDGAGNFTVVATFDTDDFSTSISGNKTEFANSDNVYDGQEIARAQETGSATVNFNSGSTAQPEFLDVFRHPVDAPGNKWYVVETVGRAETREVTKVPITFAITKLSGVVVLDGVNHTLPT